MDNARYPEMKTKIDVRIITNLKSTMADIAPPIRDATATETDPMKFTIPKNLRYRIPLIVACS